MWRRSTRERGTGRPRTGAGGADAAYLDAARALSRGRQKAAKALDRAVGAELPPLKLERARFITEIDTDEAGRDPAGIDRVEFWAQTNPGTKPGPLMKVASGGELSRFMLALKVVLADRGSAPTLVFDEIDTGVGGAVADAIGQRLSRLADAVQVMAVTHAPQVAARARATSSSPRSRCANPTRVATRVVPLAAAPRRRRSRGCCRRHHHRRGRAPLRVCWRLPADGDVTRH
jgi:DNA repair protein RecN (Recombination protein N)